MRRTLIGRPRMDDGRVRPDPPVTACCSGRGNRSAEEALERSGARHVAQAGQRLLLDLTDTLARNAEQRPDLLECHRLFAIEPEVEAENLRLALLEAR